MVEKHNYKYCVCCCGAVSVFRVNTKSDALTVLTTPTLTSSYLNYWMVWMALSRKTACSACSVIKTMLYLKLLSTTSRIHATHSRNIVVGKPKILTFEVYIALFGKIAYVEFVFYFVHSTSYIIHWNNIFVLSNIYYYNSGKLNVIIYKVITDIDAAVCVFPLA